MRLLLEESFASILALATCVLSDCAQVDFDSIVAPSLCTLTLFTSVFLMEHASRATAFLFLLLGLYVKALFALFGLTVEPLK